MNLKLSTLLCAFAVAQLHAATPEAAMNAARVPEADLVVNISVAKIYASEFAKPAIAFVEKLNVLIAREDKEAVQRFDVFINACKNGGISPADVRTVSFAGDMSGTGLPPFALHVEKPLTLESFRKCAIAFGKWNTHGYIKDFENIENGVSWINWGKNVFAILVGDGNNVVYYGNEKTVEPALKRFEAGTRVEYMPAMKALLDETLTRRDAYLVVAVSNEIRRDFNRMIFRQMDFDMHTPTGQKTQDAINAFDAFTVGVDSTDKLSVTANLAFNAPEHAAFANEFLSAVGLGAIKAGIFTFTGAGMPFMDSLKASAQDKTVTVTGEIVAKDLEILLAGIEKMFPPPKPERRPSWD